MNLSTLALEEKKWGQIEPPLLFLCISIYS